MYQVSKNYRPLSEDTAHFVERLNRLVCGSRSEGGGLFEPDESIVVARAPGRLDVMGGIADYSGSLVLELPIREATFVALQPNPFRTLSIITTSHDGRESFFDLSLESLEENHGQPVKYEIARSLFQQDPSQSWAAYVAGVFLVLMRERGVVFKTGARILVDSQVPEGKGVSSSAALEVATMSAVAAGFEIALEPLELAMLCQKVENLVVGAPCGIMDQVTVSRGEEGHLLALLCQPAELVKNIPIQQNIKIWGLDSGVLHSVSGDAYGGVRAAAFMGYRIIAERNALRVTQNPEGTLHVDDPNWRGYLANISPEEFEQNYARYLPERMSGADFLGCYGGITDSVSRIDRAREYLVKTSTAHPIFENSRVKKFSNLIGQASSEALASMGELMYQSHASYSACGLGSEETDLLVDIVREAGSGSGLYGARITGGGSGGTVAVLGDRRSDSAIAGIVERYAERTGYRPYVFSGSSPGSDSFGTMRLIPA